MSPRVRSRSSVRDEGDLAARGAGVRRYVLRTATRPAFRTMRVTSPHPVTGPIGQRPPHLVPRKARPPQSAPAAPAR